MLVISSAMMNDSSPVPPKLTKAKKAEWHDRMRLRACQYANELCQNCQKVTLLDNGVIHHLQYPVGVYEQEVETLIDQSICVWLCKACHEQAHIAESFDETRTTVKNAGYCYYCGKLAYGGWERGKSLGIAYCICKKCLKAIRTKEKQERDGQLSLFSFDEDVASDL